MKEIIRAVNTGHHREITVYSDLGNIYLKAEDLLGYSSASKNYVQTFLQKEHAIELGTALLEAAGHQVTYTPDELPKVTEGWNDNRLHSNNMGQDVNSDPKMVMKKALGLLAIAKELEKRQAEAVERNKAEAKAEKEREEKLNKRRNALIQQLMHNPDLDYGYATILSQKAIDRIIDLEDALPKKYEL